MLDIDKIYDELLATGIAKEAVTELFVVFSRFEYALKQAGYVKGKFSREIANPQWEGFQTDIKDYYQRGQDARVDDAIDFLCCSPPEEQVFKEGKLAFCLRQSPDPSDMSSVLDLVKTVRNNLFHGGKFPEGPVADPSRDGRLIEDCLVVLDACLRWCRAARNSNTKLFAVWDAFASSLG